jgi:hypothetical protein
MKRARMTGPCFDSTGGITTSYGRDPEGHFLAFFFEAFFAFFAFLAFFLAAIAESLLGFW